MGIHGIRVRVDDVIGVGNGIPQPSKLIKGTFDLTGRAVAMRETISV